MKTTRAKQLGTDDTFLQLMRLNGSMILKLQTNSRSPKRSFVRALTKLRFGLLVTASKPGGAGNNKYNGITP